MKKRKVIIFLVCFFVLAINIIGCGSRDPMVYYREAEGLNQEVAEAIQNGSFKFALTKSKSGLAKLEFIKHRFPEWEYMVSHVVPLEEEFKKRINLIELRLRLQIGYDYQQQGKYEEALREYKVALDRYKDQPQSSAIVQRAIGDTYFQQGKYEEALEAYTIVLEKYKDQPRLTSALAQVSIGKIYILTGKYEDALKVHNTVLSEYKDQTDACVMAQYEIGDIYQRMGKYNQALDAWQKLVNEYGTHPYAQITKFILENIPIELYQEMLEECRDILPIIIKFLLGQISDKEFLSSSVKLGEKFKNDALYVIATKYQMDGKGDKATKYYQRCIDVSKDKDLAYDMALKALEKIKGK